MESLHILHTKIHGCRACLCPVPGAPVVVRTGTHRSSRNRLRQVLVFYVTSHASNCLITMGLAYETTLARKRDVSIIPGIELAAAALLADHAPEAILAETSSQQELENAQANGHLWVALADDVPVGFAQIELLEPGAVHLKEIDVLPDYGRRGLGRKLVMTVCEWAAHSGYESVTLTTFRDVAWNMPFYTRLGFAEIPDKELTVALLEILHVEASRGLDPARRVAMRRPCK